MSRMRRSPNFSTSSSRYSASRRSMAGLTGRMIGFRLPPSSCPSDRSRFSAHVILDPLQGADRCELDAENSRFWLGFESRETATSVQAWRSRPFWLEKRLQNPRGKLLEPGTSLHRRILGSPKSGVWLSRGGRVSTVGGSQLPCDYGLSGGCCTDPLWGDPQPGFPMIC